MPKHLRAYTLRSTLFFGLLALLGAAACDDSTTTNNGTPTGPSLDGGADVTPSGDPADPTPDEILSGGSCPAPSGAGTDHAGIVTADETWTAAGSPHRVTSALDIRANITIEPCARVVVSNTSISVGTDSNAGSLIAHGTSQLVDGKKDVRPILFEAADKTQGWVQLGVYPKGKVDLSIAAIVDGGGESSGESGALLAKGVAGGTNDGEITRNLTVDRVVVERSSMDGERSPRRPTSCGSKTAAARSCLPRFASSQASRPRCRRRSRSRATCATRSWCARTRRSCPTTRSSIAACPITSWGCFASAPAKTTLRP